jgi:uncharacterized membrane protein YdfJ with MMPL/SSD domain
VFGSLAAAALPLGLGAISVTITGALIHLLSRQLEMSVFVSNMASMIGIGVAVDYSLFVLARYREEVRAAVDATVVRLVLVPAAMELLGRLSWWVPGPLRRVLATRGLEEAVA